MSDDRATEGLDQRISALISEREDWLMARILDYAKARDYAKYTSTLKEAWRLSISGLSSSLIESLKRPDDHMELGPDQNFAHDPVASFGVTEARLHQQRGVNLGMFLGLMKYYRQCYLDLIDDVAWEAGYKARYRHRVRRFFDRVEIGFCVEWASQAQGEVIDRLQNANRAMTNEKNKYLTVFESQPNPVVVVDREHRVENMNQSAARLFLEESVPGARYYRMPEDETSEKTLFADLFPWLADDYEEFYVETGAGQWIEREADTQKGRRHFAVRFAPMLDVSGKFYGAVIILDDITDRKKAQETLQFSENALRTIFNSTHDALCIYDLNGKLENFNDKMLEMFMIDRNHVEGLSFRQDLSDPANPLAEVDGVWERALSGETMMFEWKARRLGDNSFFDAEIVLRRIHLNDREVVLASVRDISEKKRAEEERLRREKLEGILELAGAVCHELNQPVMAISGYSELALMSVDPDHALYDKLKKIDKQVQRMGGITKKLMQLTRHETKRYTKGSRILDIDRSSGTSPTGTSKTENDSEKRRKNEPQ